MNGTSTKNLMISVATYYKHIMNYIGSGISQQVFGGTTYDITTPVNGPGGDLEGLELTFQSRLYFLPSYLNDFGIYANASFVSSNIKEFHPMLNPYSMGGLAKNSDEIDLYVLSGWIRSAGRDEVPYVVHDDPRLGSGSSTRSMRKPRWMPPRRISGTTISASACRAST